MPCDAGARLAGGPPARPAGEAGRNPGPCRLSGRPKKVDRLQITKPGVYDNYLVDSHWAGGNRVKITSGNVTLRHCEICNSTGNGVGVFADDVVIEDCKIHHCLKSTFQSQEDAHGITGHPRRLRIANCEICYVSGDCVQFDPDRKPWGDVVIENCTFWTGPLPADAAGFRKGQRPGENAFDSKSPPGGPALDDHPAQLVFLRL